MPHFEDQNKNTWNVLSMHWSIDFGGRCCEIETQNADSGKLKTFIIYYLSGDFVQHNKEESVDANPTKGIFYESIMSTFFAFTN